MTTAPTVADLDGPRARRELLDLSDDALTCLAILARLVDFDPGNTRATAASFEAVRAICPENTPPFAFASALNAVLTTLVDHFHPEEDQHG